MEDDVRKKLSCFGFKRMPFSYEIMDFHMNGNRQLLLDRLRDFLCIRGFAVISGDPGTGKSMLLKHLCSSLPSNSYKVVYIPFATLGSSDILKYICLGLGIEIMFSRSRMLHNIQNHIAHMQPINVVILLDEVQKASLETLETIRLMANFKFDDRPYISIIMSGNEDFLQNFQLKAYLPLKQRVSCFGKVLSFSREETAKYIMGQFESAGIQRTDIVTTPAVNNVFDASLGVPRVIDKIMFEALKQTVADSKDVVDLEHVRMARANLLLSDENNSRKIKNER